MITGKKRQEENEKGQKEMRRGRKRRTRIWEA